MTRNSKNSTIEDLKRTKSENRNNRLAQSSCTNTELLYSQGTVDSVKRN